MNEKKEDVIFPTAVEGTLVDTKDKGPQIEEKLIQEEKVVEESKDDGIFIDDRVLEEKPAEGKDKDSFIKKTEIESKQETSQQKRKSKTAPVKQMTYSQELAKIPADILNNPHVIKKYNINSGFKANPPRAAMSNEDYRYQVPPKLDDFTNSLVSGTPIIENPSIDQLKSANHQLRALEKDYIAKGQYMDAKKVAQIMDIVSSKIQQKKDFADNKSTIEELLSKRNELSMLVSSTERDWDEQIEQHKKNTTLRIAEIEQKHQEEMEEFDTAIPSELQPTFKRFSVTYLKMRSKEKYLAYNRHFDEAQAMKEKADALEQKETGDNYERMDRFFQEKRSKLLEKQNKSMNAFLDYSKGRLLELKSQKTKSLEGINRRISILQDLIENECDKKNITPGELNMDIIDEKRMEILKITEKDLPIPQYRCSSALSKSSTKQSAPITKPKVSPSIKV